MLKTLYWCTVNMYCVISNIIVNVQLTFVCRRNALMFVVHSLHKIVDVHFEGHLMHHVIDKISTGPTLFMIN